MPVRVAIFPEDAPGHLGGCIASEMMNLGYNSLEHSSIYNYKDDIWPYPGIPRTNFGTSWPTNLSVRPGPQEQTGLPLHRLSATQSMKIRDPQGDGRVPAAHAKRDDRSHASSEETLLYPGDLPNNDPLGKDEDSESTEASNAGLEKVYEEYLAEGEENGPADMGVTIMLRDISYRMQVEPHVFDLLQSTSDLSHVDYIYLPMTINHGCDAKRNKGYCFIHFSNNASAQLFVSRLANYVLPDSLFPSEKTMIAGLAKFQGLSLNLHNLLDIHSKKWRPRNGHVYIRCAGGTLAPYGLLRLRKLLKRRAGEHLENMRRCNLINQRADGRA
jgi:hypothetical protein